MEASLTKVERRARWAYEFGRGKRALWGTLPIASLAVAAMLLFPMVWQSYVAAGVMGAVALVALYWGKTPARAVLPGVLAGLAPLGCSYFARIVGHVCTGGACFSACLPLCIGGGVVAGVTLGQIARAREQRGWFSAVSVLLAWCVGSMGCGCVQQAGALGIVGGLLLGVLPALFLPGRQQT